MQKYFFNGHSPNRWLHVCLSLWLSSSPRSRRHSPTAFLPCRPKKQKRHKHKFSPFGRMQGGCSNPCPAARALSHKPLRGKAPLLMHRTLNRVSRSEWGIHYRIIWVDKSCMALVPGHPSRPRGSKSLVRAAVEDSPCSIICNLADEADRYERRLGGIAMNEPNRRLMRTGVF